MKIGFDSKRLYCNFTGLGNYSRTLVKNLGNIYPDNEYYLYTPRIKDTPETTFFRDGAYKTRLPKATLKPLWRSYSIIDQLIEDELDIYHGLSHEIPFQLQKAGIKSIVTIHDLIFKVYPETYSFLDRKIYDFKFKHSCVHADKVIAISNNTKKDIIRFYNIDPDKIEVIYQSINPLFFHPKGEKEKNKTLKQYNIPNDYLLCVGSIEKRKNVELIIKAYEHLKPDCKIPLVVIGRGKEYKQQVVDLINRQRLKNKVLFIDYLDDNHHLASIYQSAKALIYPSLYEGFGLPIAEALLSKTPVITSQVSSLPEAGGPDSYYIDPTKPVELAEAITSVLSDSELNNRMKENGYDYAIKTFSAERVTQQLMSCYQSAIQQ